MTVGGREPMGLDAMLGFVGLVGLVPTPVPPRRRYRPLSSRATVFAN